MDYICIKKMYDSWYFQFKEKIIYLYLTLNSPVSPVCVPVSDDTGYWRVRTKTYFVGL